MTLAAIKAIGVSKWFGEGETRTVAVNDVSLEASYGEMLYIVGPSGSGKTTFLSMISGVLRPSAGKVEIAGKDIWALSDDQIADFRLHTVGFVFQDFHLFPRLTTVENVAVPLILRKRNWNASIEEARHYLDVVGLAKRADLPPGKLSGGEQQRVAIARAIAGKPDILILDEPTASLDGDTGRKIVEFVKTEVLDEHRAILIVTHDSRIYGYADRIVKMEDGHIVGIEKELSMLRNKVIFVLVLMGIAFALSSAYVYAVPSKPLPPVWSPAPNPYAQGIYADGIVESSQTHGANVNIYPEVTGTITHILVAEGQSVDAGTPLVTLDDTVQRATVEQQQAQVEAAQALLDELHAQPRKEALDVARAQVELASASLKSARDQMAKQQRSFELAPESVSRDALDNAVNAFKVASANADMVTRQYELTRAGAWVYDIKNQERQREALVRALAGSSALLAKYTIKAPADGVVMSVQAAVGTYVSPQGAYDTYTQGFVPVMVMGTANGHLDVRCYVDEILIPRLPPAASIQAQMFIRGTDTKIPLEFVRVQPYVSPKIQLSNQRLEKVDQRVLPVIFRFEPPPGVSVYPGELVDVYIGEK